MKIPLSQPDITEAEIEAVASVLRSSRLSLGPKLEEFEQAMAAYIGVAHGVGVSSGTSGLHLCIRGLGIGEGDEVIVPSFTFVAAANAVRYERARPVFVDVDAVTLNLDPAKIEEAITQRTRAIMAVHTFGIPASMEAILAIARRHDLFVIEDACEAIGAEYKDHRVGGFGHAAVFAFYPNKQITTGEGGMIVTRDPALAKKMRALRNQGRYDSDDWFQHSELGYNYRLSEINCALGIEQIKRIDEILTRREAVALAYQNELGSVSGLTLPPMAVRDSRISWFVYVARVLDGRLRHALLGFLTKEGVGCGRYFAPIHLQPSYAEWKNRKLPVTERESQRTLALPFFNRLSKAQIKEVAEVLRAGLQKFA
jgi:perosamine synthetase